jgi:two-component system nitrogen regulation response regulator NtrX
VAAERILVVDDEPGVRSALCAILRDEGFDVHALDSGEAALEALERESYDAVLLDVWLPGLDGLETLQRLRERQRDLEVVMISGHGTIDTAVRATRTGAFDFVEKPLSLDRILLVLRNALQKRRLQQSNRALLEQLARDTEIIGSSPAVVRLREGISAAAASDAPVLICGEPGTGRETVARRIHAAGRRQDAPFVEVPCGALEAQAAARALFGDDAAGSRIDLARSGSVFLEDVERLAEPLQRRLAAAVQDLLRQGPAPRLLASAPPRAHGVLAELRGMLDVIRLDVPALAARREDIPQLIERSMRELAREYGREVKRFADEAQAALVGHSWPGNARELRNVVERVLLLSPHDVVRVEDLPGGLGGTKLPDEDLYREFPTLAEGVRTFERYFLRRALAREGGNEEAASRRAGLSREELLERLRDSASEN